MSRKTENHLKILHIISSGTVGGAEKCFLEMLAASRKTFAGVAAVCSAGGELERLAADACDKVYTAAMADNADVFSLYKLYKIIGEYKPDLCHLHMNRATLLGALAAKFNKVKSIGSIQGEVRPIYAYFPDYLTFCSKNVADHVRSRSSAVASKPSFYLYNCIDNSALAKLAETGGRAFLREEFGIPENAFVVCQVARLHQNKGHAFLIDAIYKNIGKIPDLYCLIVGAGDKKYEEQLKTQAENLGISNRFIFTGLRLDVARIISGADLFALPSLQEGIPVTIMEALSLRLPCVAFDVGGIYELADTAAASEPFITLVPARDTEALASAIYNIYANYPHYKSIAQKAGVFMVKHYDKTKYVNDINAIYRGINFIAKTR
ncbi:MAG TPA: glycosyltransferase [Candidatus Wallbacteria bacterium]|mgnify:CR=1 FL=1|nr:MAG: GDP-mannose-dependent alpha-(1-6)-phosphatidylinositol monomannoside mannosyltransferase [bacterium ADurb.Bin243]HOD40826.1 glycosyltransferase [Candidatus Wallbacteria bacterium]HPG59181.1 glycosyltransferase [Candidatus Wallbacteria bacterium]